MKSADTYTTYEAKAKFSEVLRKVRGNRRVIVTHHGTAVAIISPLPQGDDEIESAYQRGIEAGLIAPATNDSTVLSCVAKRKGGLQRFLDERE